MKKKRLLIYFCICVALFTLLGISFVSLSKLNALEDYNKRVDNSYQVIIKTNELEQNLLNAETGQRAFLLTEDPAFLENYLGRLKGIPGIFLELDYLTADNHVQQQNLDTLKEIINLQLRLLKSNLGADMEDTLMMSRFRESNVFMNKIRALITNIKENESLLLVKRNESKELNNKESKDSSFLSMAIAFGVCCIAAIAIIAFFNLSEGHRSNLEAKIRELNILNREVRELTLASTHNLQEPMRKIQLMIDRLQHLKDTDGHQLKEQTERIKQIYNQQREINNNIVDYYQILAGSGPKEPIELGAWLQELVRENNWQEAFRLEIESLKSIEADPYQLKLLFSHIIRNSIRFADPQRPLVIGISGGNHIVKEGKYLNREKKTYYRITISDNGTGIPQEFHTKIFQMFQKIETADKLSTGMGLSFCRRIMLNHQGWIAARNNEPHGLTLCLFFPVS